MANLAPVHQLHIHESWLIGAQLLFDPICWHEPASEPPGELSLGASWGRAVKRVLLSLSSWRQTPLAMFAELRPGGGELVSAACQQPQSDRIDLQFERPEPMALLLFVAWRSDASAGWLAAMDSPAAALPLGPSRPSPSDAAP